MILYLFLLIFKIYIKMSRNGFFIFLNFHLVLKIFTKKTEIWKFHNKSNKLTDIKARIFGFRRKFEKMKKPFLEFNELFKINPTLHLILQYLWSYVVWKNGKIAQKWICRISLFWLKSDTRRQKSVHNSNTKRSQILYFAQLVDKRKIQLLH